MQVISDDSFHHWDRYTITSDPQIRSDHGKRRSNIGIFGDRPTDHIFFLIPWSQGEKGRKHRRTGRGGGGWGGCSPPPPPPPPPTFGQLRFFGQQDKFGQSFLKKFPYFFEEIDIFYFTWSWRNSMRFWLLVKGVNCWYTYFLMFYCWKLYCTSWCGVFPVVNQLRYNFLESYLRLSTGDSQKF